MKRIALFLIFAAVSVFATYPKNKGTITFPESSPAVLAYSGTIRDSASDTLYLLGLDTSGNYFNTSNLAKVMVNVGGTPAGTRATSFSKWPDSISCNWSASIDTAKTVTPKLEYSYLPSPNFAQWIAISGAAMSYTTTATRFQQLFPFIPGVYFRLITTTGSGGHTTRTTSDVRCIATYPH